MLNKSFFVLLLHLSMLDSTYACDNFQSIVNSEIFPDGGSINLMLKSDCKSIHVVKYTNPLQGEKTLLINESHSLPGSKEERILLQRLDGLVKKAVKNRSLDFFQDAEMKRFANGDQNTFTPLFGLMESLCMNNQTQMVNKNICSRYLPRK